MKKGQELEFNCYGTRITGKYVSRKGTLLRIRVTYDSSYVYDVSKLNAVDKCFLVK